MGSISCLRAQVQASLLAANAVAMGSTPYLRAPQVPAYSSAAKPVVMDSIPRLGAPSAAHVVAMGSTPHHRAPLVALQMGDKSIIATAVQTRRGQEQQPI